MSKLFTIGANGKSAKSFFDTLRNNQVDLLLDIRVNNSSQLSGFAKGGEEFLGYLFENICKRKYIHDDYLAPTKQLLDDYRKNRINWQQYAVIFNKLIIERNMIDYMYEKYFSKYENICILCSELDHNECHRGLIADAFQSKYDIPVIHL